MKSCDYVRLIERESKHHLRRQRIGPDEVFAWIKRAALLSLLVGACVFVARMR